MDAFLASLCSYGNIGEAFGISTCNRTEFYLSADDVHSALNTLLKRIQDERGIDLGPESSATYFFAEEAAVRHLFRVSCGIDSLIVGENEILGQLRRARESAADAGYVGSMLDPLLLRALDVGRRVRQNTSISRGNVSVASVAATLAARHFNELADKRAVVLGAGETAELAARQLTERGLTQITFANRTYERARELAHAMNARQTAFSEIEKALLEADIVVCATGAPHFLITTPMVEAVMAVRSARPMLLLDVSVPRNVEPAVCGVPGVRVESLETLNQIAEENRLHRESQIARVEELIEQESARFRSDESCRDTSRVVAALHRRIEQVRQAHITRYGHFFDDDHQPHLDTFTSGLTRSLLHELVCNLRTLDLETDEGRARLRMAQELFNLVPDDGGD